MRRPSGRAAVLALRAVLVAAVSLSAFPAGAAEVRSLFPSDRLTAADPEQATGRRVRLPLPDCRVDPAGCQEVRLLGELDGFSVTPRLAIRFSGPIALGTVTRQSAFLLPLLPEPLPSPVGLVQLVWDGESTTLYARPERALLQRRPYALVVTSRVLDGAGRPVRAGRAGPGVAAEPGVPEPRILDRLRALGIERREVVAASIFTTQSVTVDLERIRALLDGRPPAEIRFALAPGGGRSVYSRGTLEALALERQVGAAPEGGLAEPAGLPLTLLPPGDVGTLAFGSFRSVSFLTTERHIPAVPSRAGTPRVQAEEEVHLTLALPAGPPPPAGFPVAIFGHGFGGDRHGSLAVVAGTLARHGFATVAINVVGHGGGAAGRLIVTEAGRPAARLPAGGRGLDLDGDGRIGSTEGVGTLAGGPLALVSVRDGLRQTAADLMQLVRALRRGVDVDGDGRPDLDGDRIFYFGQSFGGIYGTLLMAVDPLVRAGVLNVPGGPVAEIARQAEVFRPRVIEALRARTPSLMNGERDFHEMIPGFGDPPLHVSLPGALAIQGYLDRAEWLGQSANPVAFAPYLRLAPLGGRPRAVLYQWAVGDLTVPNPTTASILRAGGLHAHASLYRHDRVVGTLSDRFRNPHGFLSWVAFPPVADIGRAAQEQVARFFLSDGREVARTDPRFEVGPAR